jgi:hypothetical protein
MGVLDAQSPFQRSDGDCALSHDKPLASEKAIRQATSKT